VNEHSCAWNTWGNWKKAKPTKYSPIHQKIRWPPGVRKSNIRLTGAISWFCLNKIRTGKKYDRSLLKYDPNLNNLRQPSKNLRDARNSPDISDPNNREGNNHDYNSFSKANNNIVHGE
jgi:hypothetical protein